MGEIKTYPQIDQNGQQTSKMLLEIIYGGKEAPFGGIDAGNPARYIHPNCFVDANGFMISAGRITAGGFFNANIQLNQWITFNCVYMTAGSFWANGQYNNFVVGYTFQRQPNAPANNTTTYYIWSWPSGTTGLINLTAQISDQQYDVYTPPNPAIAIINVLGGPATVGGTVSATIGGIGPMNATVNINDTAATVAANLAAAINAFGGTPVNALVGGPNNQYITLTTIAASAAANATTLVVSGSSTSNPVPSIGQNFQGGTNALSTQYAIPINPASWLAIGETIYISGGSGTVILSFTNNAILGYVFNFATKYLGANKLAKIGGFLVALGVNPGPLLNVSAPEMIIAWSANGKFGIWYAVDGSGNVTGAGFNQTADISDYITGGILTNTMLVVLRTQGIDYLTVTGSGALPFDTNHISNATLGEGCQDGRLAAVYDQIGIFVGNSDIFQYAGGMKSIGARIRNNIVPASRNANVIARDSLILPLNLGIEVDAVFVLAIDLIYYLYNIDNETWMQFYTSLNEVQGNFSRFAIFASLANIAGGTQVSVSQNLMLVTQIKQLIAPFHSAPVFWQFQPFIQNVDFNRTVAPYIVFPQEELAFGRDVVIDALYLTAAGMPGQVVNFNIAGPVINGVSSSLNAQLVIGPEGDGATLNEYKVFFTNGTYVGKAPQLTLSVPLGATGVLNPLSFGKIMMLGSFDPNQRPA